MEFTDVIVRGKPFLSNLLDGRLEDTALVVAGGGFQGVWSGGVLMVMQELGLSRAFKAAYGVSSGSSNVALFLAGQTRLGAPIYYQDLVDHRYCSFWRWPPVNIAYLVDEIFGKAKPLNTEAIITSGTVFKIPIVDTDGDVHFLTVGDGYSVLEALKFGMSFFPYSRAPLPWKNMWYFDGRMAEPLPFRKALADGSKNILVLINQSVHMVVHDEGLFSRAFKWPFLRRQSSGFRRVYQARHRKYQEQLADLIGGELPHDANITIIAPHQQHPTIPFYTRNSLAIRELCLLGIAAGQQVFGRTVKVTLP